MRWEGGRESGNVEDSRGIGGGGIAVGGGIIGVIVLLVNLLSGGEVNLPVPAGGQSGGGQPMSAEAKAREDNLASFSKVTLGYTEDVWNQVLPQQSGKQYEEPILKLFTGSVQSGCGGASAASGPFYCPGDHKLYLDLSFFDELGQRFGAAGDFAMAYVIAHEVGHHIQTLLGTSAKMNQLRQQLGEAEYNKYSVMMELQADFLAGVWAHYVQGKQINGKPVLEEGDIEEALTAANAIGDDRLTQGRVSPDNFTHGTSAQRMYWFKKGFQSGQLSQGDTFNDPSLQ